jgi:hypothetical protein
MISTETLGDVCRNRARRAPHLTTEVVPFWNGNAPDNAMHSDQELNSPLPGPKIFVAPNWAPLHVGMVVQAVSATAPKQRT